jgi:hypothetical protein
MAITTSTNPLGKKPAIIDPRTFQLAEILNAHSNDIPLAPSVDWSKGITSWGALLNNTLGDCTCAAVGHAIQVESVNAESKEVSISDGDILALYESACGYQKGIPATDEGGACLVVLAYWRKNAVHNRKLRAYAAIEPNNYTHIMQVVSWLGGCYCGLLMPISAQGQKVWSVPPGGPYGQGAPGSWGGHCVYIDLSNDMELLVHLLRRSVCADRSRLDRKERRQSHRL